MEEIPAVTIRRGKIRRENKIWKKKERVELIEELIEKYGTVYIIDMDGKKGSPNLKLYKSIGKKIWVDTFPRDLNDILDLVVCGIEKITIRSFDEKYLEEIKNTIENEVFIFDEIEKAKKYKFAGVVTEKDLDCDCELQIWKLSGDFIRRVK
ncbi:MAG: hypothetical protein H5T45_03690 [Thermoplasmatales archaeon]|nr:hypothetical protein [Thermoplasmatales archaeon]